MVLLIVENMNKKLRILSVCALLLFVILSSLCMGGEDKKTDKKKGGNDELDRFIGTWVGEWDWGNNLTRNETWAFYANRTVKIVDEFGVDWGTYGLEDDQLKIKIPTPTEEHPDAALTDWLDYEFTNDDKTLNFISTYGKEGNFITL